MKVDGRSALTRECPVYWPDERAFAIWTPPTTNGTHPGAALHYNSSNGGFWYCSIEFVEFDKSAEGVIMTNKSEPGELFSWSGQYLDETIAEEQFHIKQMRGLVSASQGGQGDCYTVKGIKYSIARQAETNSNIVVSTWIVKGDTEAEAVQNCKDVIRLAIMEEIHTSDQIWNSDRGFREVKAKEHAGYNAAFRYDCTYKNVYGTSPQNNDHPAYVVGVPNE